MKGLSEEARGLSDMGRPQVKETKPLEGVGQNARTSVKDAVVEPVCVEAGVCSAVC